MISSQLRKAGVSFEKVLNSDERKVCQNLLLYIEQETYKEVVWNDLHCLYMLFRLKWAAYTGHPVIYKEKMRLAFNMEQWKEINAIIEGIFRLSSNRTFIVLKYIQSISCFHLNDPKWEDIFKEICNLPYPSHKRIIINYVASLPNGNPQGYEGVLTSGDNERRTSFRIRVGSRNLTVPYFNAKFARQLYMINQTYRGIEIGFNFLGVQVSNLIGGR